MRVVRPSKMRNVDDARLIADAATLAERIDPATTDDSRGQWARLGAKRVLILNELASRGHDILVPGNVARCQALLGLDADNRPIRESSD